jgi:hypothetical protein
VRRASLILALFTLLSGAVHAQKIMTWNPPEHPDPPFATQLRKVVVNIDLTCKDALGTLWSSSGTGFMVAYSQPPVPKGMHLDYLVTNRHVAECRDEKGRPREVQSVTLELSLKSGTWVRSPMNQGGKVLWYFPDSDSVDLAVTPISTSPEVDYLPIPLDLFLAKEDFAAVNIGEGAKIILSGYSYTFEGERHRQPLIREGILSAMPDSPLMTTMGKPGRVYLADVHIFGGNSGSPVFINTIGLRAGGHVQFMDDYRFLGVVSGFYNEDSDFNLQITTSVKATQHAKQWYQHDHACGLSERPHIE